MTSSIWFLPCLCVNVCALKHTSVPAKVYERILAPTIHPELQMAIRPLPFLGVSRFIETNVHIGQPSHHPSVQTDTSFPHTTLPTSQYQTKTLKWFHTWGTTSTKAYVVIYNWSCVLFCVCWKALQTGSIHVSCNHSCVHASAFTRAHSNKALISYCRK